MNVRFSRIDFGTAAKRLLAALLAVLALTTAAQAASGDAKFCQSYAANVAGMGDLAIKKNPACLDYSKGVHSSYSMHYDWCMKNPQSSVQGAESNIRRLVTTCTGNATKASGGSPPPPKSAATSEEEPFGAGFDGWKFTQEATSKGILCRAWFGSSVVARYTNTSMYLSVPSGKIAKGSYPETFLEIGKDSEPVDAKSDGKRFSLHSDQGFFNKLASAQGYNYRTGPVNGKFITGKIAFNGSTGRALKELVACSKANGGR